MKKTIIVVVLVVMGYLAVFTMASIGRNIIALKANCGTINGTSQAQIGMEAWLAEEQLGKPYDRLTKGVFEIWLYSRGSGEYPQFTVMFEDGKLIRWKTLRSAADGYSL